MQTTIVALSAQDAKKFRSDEPYVVVQISDPGTKHPHLHPAAHRQMRSRISMHFDDILPEDASDENGMPRYFPMTTDHAAMIATFVASWYGKVATIIVHCHAGVSRSVGVVQGIRHHFRQPYDDLFTGGRHPNRHCFVLTARALRATTSGATSPSA